MPGNVEHGCNSFGRRSNVLCLSLLLWLLLGDDTNAYTLRSPFDPRPQNSRSTTWQHREEIDNALRAAKTKEDDENGNVPGYKFFQGDGSYVPSGMTRNEYKKLRKQEADRERRMNYGAWGPRFKRTGAPNGDWMAMPNLWTLGQVSRSPAGLQVNGDQSPRSSLRYILRFIRKYSPALLLGHVLLDCVEAGYWMWWWHVYDMTAEKAVYKIMRNVIARKQVAITTLAIIESTKVVLAVLMTPAVNMLLERTNRRILWTKGRIMTTTIGCAFSGLIIWGYLLKILLSP